ncbi:LysR substrate-binding domain-containing protein [Streptomyces sp. NPDC053750]|uniref:LysR substrate-binding domain-containing protein n=1 Tax=Streptomyces sp. NPDC053750 TaxID=3365714 RepID=UPI0037D6330A
MLPRSTSRATSSSSSPACSLHIAAGRHPAPIEGAGAVPTGCAGPSLVSGVGLRDIADESFVDMPTGFGQRQIVEDAFTRAELSRRVLIEVSDITTIADYVAHGLGVALLPPDFAEAAGDAVRVVPLADARLSWTLSVVASATRPPTRALHAFLDLIPHHIRRDRVF